MSNRSRWLIVLLPVAAITVVELSSDRYLDSLLTFPWNQLLILAAVLAITAVSASFVFRRIDRLSTTLRQRNAELEALNASTRALHEVSMATSALVDVEAILRAVVRNARDLLGADVSMLVLSRPDGTLRLAASSGPSEGFHPSGDLPGSDFRRFVEPSLIHSHLAAPLQRADRTFGTLMVGSGGERSYDVADVETLASLASQAAIALENERLQRELRELAIRGERERIAREMHDGLAQVLGYVNTKSQAVEELLAAGRINDARAQLEELAEAARSVYVDVREAILGLTSPITPERGLVGAIEEYAVRFSDASKLVTNVDATPSARTVALPPEVQAQVFRIVQEALTNIRKHAAARRASIAVDVRDGQLLVTVDDDGRGFEAAEARPGEWPHYGVRAMRERAATLGGDLELASRAGGGTRLRLAVPLGVLVGAA